MQWSERKIRERIQGVGEKYFQVAIRMQLVIPVPSEVFLVSQDIPAFVGEAGSCSMLHSLPQCL